MAIVVLGAPVGERASRAESFRPLWRPAADLGGGMVGAVGGASIVGGLTYEGMRLAGVKDVCGKECLLPPTTRWGILGAFAGGVAGIGFGVWGAGRCTGGHGALWASFAGEGVGLVGTTLLLATKIIDDNNMIWLPVPLLIGAVIGYELSAAGQDHETMANDQRNPGGPRPAIVPLLFGFF